MGYCISADIVAKMDDNVLRRLTDDNKTGAVDTSVIDGIIAEVSTEIDGFLSNRYVTPITGPVPPLLKVWCIDLVIYSLYARRMPDSIPKETITRHDQIYTYLEKVNTGRLNVGTTLIGGDYNILTPSVLRVIRTGKNRIFGQDFLDKF